MANEMLFAPRVQAVQPAFIYSEGTVKIYYTLSDFNKDLTDYSINFKLKDPNKTATIGSDLVASERGIKPEDNYFIIDVSELDLILNQYYQVQIQIEKNESVSAWSQTTLIRAIANPIIELDIPNELNELTYLSGRVVYSDSSSVEAIQKYKIDIVDNGTNKTIFSSGFINNTLGTEFATNIYDCYLAEGKEYVLKFNYITINAFSSIEIKYFNTPVINGIEKNFHKFDLSVSNGGGGNELNFSFLQSELEGLDLSIDYNIFIQRTSEKQMFKSWQTLFSFNGKLTENFKYTDLKIESHTIYQYRILIETDNGFLKYNKYKGLPLEILTQLEDIYLLGEHAQLGIRYNPNISGFKYVTQENIVNTLGGKFPIVRINGQTKYRQFSLSGTLSFKTDYYSLLSSATGSTNLDITKYFQDDNCTFLFDLETILENFPSGAKEKIKSSSSYLEKKYRALAMSFLTDQQPKLFKGAEEDSMIVFLSGVTFTPNKQLGREIWDFSCTVTEICEFNEHNLAKFNLDIGLRDYNSNKVLVYVLKMLKQQGVVPDDNFNVLDYYIPLAETFEGLPVIHAYFMDCEEEV